MKKLLTTLFVLLLVVGAYAQESVQKFDGSEFTTLSPEDNAKTYTTFLREAYKLNYEQAEKVYAFRLNTALHVQQLDKVGRGTVDYQEKRDKIMAFGQAKVLNVFTKKQLNQYEVDTRVLPTIVEDRLEREGKL